MMARHRAHPVAEAACHGTRIHTGLIRSLVRVCGQASPAHDSTAVPKQQLLADLIAEHAHKH